MKFELQNIINKFESKEPAFLQKLERVIPKNIFYLVAGTSLLLSVEKAVGQEKITYPEKIKPSKQQERILSQNEEIIFNGKFDFSIEPKLERFVVTEKDYSLHPQKNDEDLTEDLFNFCNSQSCHVDEKGKKEKSIYKIKNEANIDSLQKILDEYKTKHNDIDFKIDSLETKRTLDENDYKKIFTNFFEEEELKLMLDCVSIVKVIDSPEEERKMPDRYGFDGEAAAHFKSGENKIEFEKNYLDGCDNVKNEAETIFHEFGHAFDPVSSRLGDINTVVYPSLKKEGLPPWIEIMKKDKLVRKDVSDTFFSYPLKIVNDEIRESEDFAESFSNYFWHPLLLQEKAPNRFKVIDALVKIYLKNPKFDIYERNSRASKYLEERYSSEETKFKEKIDEITGNF